ncbi:hypothetical protein ACWC2T_37655 [Streptomyces sp. NPDC001393]
MSPGKSDGSRPDPCYDRLADRFGAFTDQRSTEYWRPRRARPGAT